MIQAAVTSAMGFMAGYLLCSVFTAGKEDDYYWQGFENGQEYARKIILAEELNNAENDKS